jgi:site-specific recombinase XerD
VRWLGGVDDGQRLGEVLGHTNIQTTKRYAHLQLGRKRAALDKVAAQVAANGSQA